MRNVENTTSIVYRSCTIYCQRARSFRKEDFSHLTGNSTRCQVHMYCTYVVNSSRSRTCLESVLYGCCCCRSGRGILFWRPSCLTSRRQKHDERSAKGEVGLMNGVVDRESFSARTERLQCRIVLCGDDPPKGIECTLVRMCSVVLANSFSGLSVLTVNGEYNPPRWRSLSFCVAKRFLTI